MKLINWYLFIFLLSAKASLFADSNLGVRAQSFGGAFRAVATSNDIIFYNPAGVLKNRRLETDVNYNVFYAEKKHALSLSILDSKTTNWGIGLSYSTELIKKTDVNNSHLVHFALAMPLISNRLFAGTSFSYSFDPSKNPDSYRHFFNMDIGMLAKFPAGLCFAVVLDHILKPKGLEKSLGLTMASAFFIGDLVEKIPLTFSFDWSMDDVKSEDELKHILGFGTEYVAFSMLPIRIGFKSNLAERNNFLSMGTGIIGTKFSLDGVYKQHLSIGKIRHFGLALRFQI